MALIDEIPGNNPGLADRFLRAANGVALQLSPTFGVVKSELTGEVCMIERETKAILCHCDGTKRVRDLLAERADAPDRPSDEDVCCAIVELVDLTRRGLLTLASDPCEAPMPLRGDPEAHSPLHLQVELTQRCNLHCSYCYRHSAPELKEDRLSTGELMEILESLREAGLQSVELTGGEPLMHPDFMKIFKFCAERFALVGILTNGVAISEELVAEWLPARQKTSISISLDSHLADVHDRRRGQEGAFRRTTRAIRLLSDHGFLTRVTMVVDESNWADLESTLLLAKSLGATKFAYTPILPLGRGKQLYHTWSLDGKMVQSRERELYEKYKDFLHVMHEESVLDLQGPGGCGAGYRTYVMDPAGRIRPCVTFDDRTAVYGSLRTQSPRELFRSEIAAAFAQVVPPQPNVCGQCEHRVFCQGCPLRGLIAAEWLGDGRCAWLQEPSSAHWHRLVLQHSA